jgi:hypothetical protein
MKIAVACEELFTGVFTGIKKTFADRALNQRPLRSYTKGYFAPR